MTYFCYHLDIIPNVSYANITEKIKQTKGEIKDSLKFDELIKCDYIHTNQNLVTFFEKMNFIFGSNCYPDTVAKVFDVFGGVFDIIREDVKYTVKIYFYKIKNTELITSSLIEEFSLIFKQSYFIKCNILDMDYHNYRLSLFFKELCNPKFLDLSYVSHPLCKTSLFRYQRHNISRILHFHNKGVKVNFDNDMIMYFENGIIYDFVKKKFLTATNIPENEIYGGIVMDEPGTGKTLQFIVYLLEVIMTQGALNTDEKALILVPNSDIKKHWISEFAKHIIIPFEDLPIFLMTVTEFKSYSSIKENMKYMDKIKIIVVDEIHTLWKQSDVFDKLIKYEIKYRWGLSATPFITQDSLFCAIKFLTGKNFVNERIANIPSVQDEIMKIFLKNTKLNTIDEYPWPELNIINIKLKFDKIQQDLYDTEAKTVSNVYNLRLIACQMELMFNELKYQTLTPKEIKQYINDYYKSQYEVELAKLEELCIQLKNIQANKYKFDPSDYKERIKHYEELIKQKENDVNRYKSAFEYHMKAISKIANVFNSANEEVDPDDICVICLCPHESPITYFKKCGHYFCKTCIDESFVKNRVDDHILCPYCRAPITTDDIIIVNDKCDIGLSAKCHKIIELVKSTPEKFIIFSQFPKMIDNLIHILLRHDINVKKFSEYKTLSEKNTNVIILSSEENAAGIDLTEFNNVIIFEPFEDSMYCNEIEKQLIGRVHRIGQTKMVNVYRLIMLNTIEEHIYSKFL